MNVPFRGIFITARKRSLGQGNFFCVILFTGGSASVHIGIPPPDQAPPWSRPPPSRHPPSRHPPGAGGPREQTPPCAVHAGRYGQQAGGMHPTGMQSCLCVTLYLQWSRCIGTGAKSFRINRINILKLDDVCLFTFLNEWMKTTSSSLAYLPFF